MAILIAKNVVIVAVSIDSLSAKRISGQHAILMNVRRLILVTADTTSAAKNAKYANSATTVIVQKDNSLIRVGRNDKLVAFSIISL